MGRIVFRDSHEEVGNFKAFKEVIPNLKVMRRSRPEDKNLMVTILKKGLNYARNW